jgi:malic enzyme
MKLTAAVAIREVVRQDTWGPEYIIPGVFGSVVPAVARAVIDATEQTGVARQRGPASGAAQEPVRE